MGTGPDPQEYDVFVCCREPSGAELARIVSDGLTRRGFRVFYEERLPADRPDARRLAIIEDTPDFVLLLTPDTLDPSAGEQDPTRVEIAHALRSERNVVAMTVPGTTHPQASELPPDLVPLAESQQLSYNPDRRDESIAFLWHRLSSQASRKDRSEVHGTKRLLLFVGLFLLGIILVEVARVLPKMLARPPETRPLAPFALYWSGVGQRLDNGRWTQFELTDGAPVMGGDRIKLVFSPSADGCAYVMSRDLAGEVSVLFPYTPVKAASRVRARELYEAPVETRWFTVTEKAGLAALYILASYDPISNLEEVAEAPEGKLAADSRRSLLDTTIQGLLDGRHGVVGRTAYTSGRRPIHQNLEPGPGPATSSITLVSGAVVARPLVKQPGLLSAMVEIRVKFEQAPASRPTDPGR